MPSSDRKLVYEITVRVSSSNKRKAMDVVKDVVKCDELEFVKAVLVNQPQRER
jgi:hypothetical protein